MHVHRAPIDLNISNLYAVEAAKKAAEAQKAAEVRRKLLRASAGIGDGSFSEDGIVLLQDDGEGSSQGGGSAGAGYFAGSSSQPGKARKASGEQSAPSLSIWA